MTGSFRWVAEEPIYSGPVISLSDVTVAAPDGSEFHREVVHHPGAVAVVPIDDQQRAVLVRQYRAPVQTEVLEIPAGKRDVVGEAPEATAKRELAEECGLAAARWVKVAEFFNSCGFSDELSYVYLATDLSEVATDAQGEEEAHLTLERVPLADVPAMIAEGQLRDAKTVIGLLLALRFQSEL